MNTVLLVGAGNIGSRHLQGLSKSQNDLDIWVYDLNDQSLQIAKERFEQMPKYGNKEVHYVSSLKDVPYSIDVAIVATGSKPRASIIRDVVAQRSIKYMVMEKFLFGKVSEYHEIGDLLVAKGIKAWVNCPFRMFEGYQRLKTKLDLRKPVIASYGQGGNWGLCCNSIHYIDIFMFLVDEDIFSVDLSGLAPYVIESKRPGYIELIGDLSVHTPNGNVLTLQTSLDGETDPVIRINNGTHVIAANESQNNISFDGETFSLGFTYQSGLSGKLIDDLIKEGNCELSTFEVSSRYHLSFLKSIIPFVNNLKGWNTDSCPIT